MLQHFIFITKIKKGTNETGATRMCADVFWKQAAFELFNLITSESAKLRGIERNWNLSEILLKIFPKMVERWCLNSITYVTACQVTFSYFTDILTGLPADVHSSSFTGF